MIVAGIELITIGMAIAVVSSVSCVDVKVWVPVIGAIMYIAGCIITDIGIDLEDKKFQKKFKQLEDKINVMMEERK